MTSIILCFKLLFLICFCAVLLGGSDLKILRDRNGRIESDSLRTDSEKCQLFAVEEEKAKKKGISVSVSDFVFSGHNEMEGSLDERLGLEGSQKVEESQSDDKKEVDVDEENVELVVESGEGVVSETKDGEAVIQSEVIGVLVESEKVEEETKEASEPILSSPTDLTDAIKEPDEAESRLEESQEKDLLIPEETEECLEEKDLPSSEETSVFFSALEEAVETVKAEEDKLASSEEKNELSSVEATEVLKNSYYSLPPSDAVTRAIEETSILKPDQGEESKLPAEEGEKVEEPSSVVQESPKEVYVPPAETTSSAVQGKTEIPRSTENKVGNSRINTMRYFKLYMSISNFIVPCLVFFNNIMLDK